MIISEVLGPWKCHAEESNWSEINNSECNDACLEFYLIYLLDTGIAVD